MDENYNVLQKVKQDNGCLYKQQLKIPAPATLWEENSYKNLLKVAFGTWKRI